MPNPIDQISINLDQIQGNILAGFNKDHQRFLFLSIVDAAKTKTWIKNLLPHISTTTAVKAFNDEFRRQRKVLGVDPPGLVATWLNLAVTFAGLQALGVKDLANLPPEFVQGMAARKNIIGDQGPSDPSHWQPAFQNPHKLHLLVLIASDDPASLAVQANTILSSLSAGGLSLLLDQHGENLTGALAGHEHFGFKDGVSQPGVKGFTLSVNDAPGNGPHQGVPGQDLLWPGEFVIGYPTQIPQMKSGFDGPNPDKGANSVGGPAWTKDGSFLVFRKLEQDVNAFRSNVNHLAGTLGVTPELLGTKMVGRFASGCPIQPTPYEVAVDALPTIQASAEDGFPANFDPNNGDPSAVHEELLMPNLINNFEYGKDLQGAWVPRAGHVRKAYPRDEMFLQGNGQPDPNSPLNESFTQTKRMLRRGIPYGPGIPIPSPVAAGVNGTISAQPVTPPLGLLPVGPLQPIGPFPPISFPPFPVERGLLFLAYQKSIASQFEFVQQSWINDPNFPQQDDGLDPIMSQTTSGTMTCPIKGKSTTFTTQHFVTTMGGEYFFQPSLSALGMMSTA